VNKGDYTTRQPHIGLPLHSGLQKMSRQSFVNLFVKFYSDVFLLHKATSA